MKTISDNDVLFLQITTQIQPNPWICFHIAKKRIGSHKKSMKMGGDKQPCRTWWVSLFLFWKSK
jgi:hypothetical protein